VGFLFYLFFNYLKKIRRHKIWENLGKFLSFCSVNPNNFSNSRKKILNFQYHKIEKNLKNLLLVSGFFWEKILGFFFLLSAYFKKYIDNCNYYVFLVIFQKHKNTILMNVTHLGGSFDHVFTLRTIKIQNVFLSLKLQCLYNPIDIFSKLFNEIISFNCFLHFLL
jgi:hypothetical protein